MRVLLVTNTYPPADISGVGSLAEELLEGLGDRAEIRVLTRAAPQDRAGIDATGGSKAAFPLRAAFWALARGRETPDIIHVSESDGALVALLVAFRRSVGRPVPRLVAAFQVSYTTEAAEVRPLRVDGRTVSSPAGSEKVFKYLRAPLLALAGRLTAHLADHVVACSRFTARELERDYRVSPERMTVIPNGLRIAPGDAPASNAREDGELRAVFVGRLRTRKAVAVLLEALARPQARAVRLSIVGDGEQRGALEGRVRSAGLEDRVRFCGQVPRDRVAEHYARADVFVLPSTYEGFPVTILEAMTHGLPIVATRVAGIPEAVVHDVSGVLVEPEDAEALADALAGLASDPERRRAMGEAGRARVRERFDLARVGARYLALWEQLAGSGVSR